MRTRDLGTFPVQYYGSVAKTVTSYISADDAWAKAYSGVGVPPILSAGKIYHRGLISDELGKNHKCNECDHVSSHFMLGISGIVGTVRRYTTTPPKWVAVAYNGSGQNPIIPGALSALSLPIDVLNRGWWKTRPRVSSEISLQNFAIEMPELKELPFAVKKVGDGLCHLAEKSKNLPKRLRRPVSGLALLYSFALAPLYGDMSTLYNLMGSIDKSYGKYVRRGKKVEVYHYSEDGPDNFTGLKIANTGLGKIVKDDITRFHASYWCTYSYTGNPGDYLVDILGITPSLESLWNALPFSFLVDYVCRIGDMLSQFGASRTVVDCKEVCLSGKRNVTLKEIFDECGSVFPISIYVTTKLSGSEHQHLWSYSQNQYVRTKPISWVPGTLVGPELVLPSLKQCGNTIALLRSLTK